MTAKKKHGGRATPKGTKNPPKSTKAQRTDIPQPAAPHAGHLPERIHKELGRATRPITHNRGNR